MMGFAIEAHAPNAHLLWAVVGVVDLFSPRVHLTEFFNSTGR